MIMVIFTVVTYLIYLLSKKVYKKITIAAFHPLLFAPMLLIGLITIAHVPANQYLQGSAFLSHMLAPATVAFAVPIYKNLPIIKKHIGIIFISITSGTLVAMISTFLLSKLIHLSDDFIISILPRSITTPIAMEVSKEIGGLPALTTVFVIITGIAGGIVGPKVLQWLSIQTPVAKGLALGMGAHGVGTNKALEYGKQESVFSSLAMIFAALFTLLWGTLITPFI